MDARPRHNVQPVAPPPGNRWLAGVNRVDLAKRYYDGRLRRSVASRLVHRAVREWLASWSPERG